ncbi:type II secretion system F family protein [Blastococcus xanthinilyticus]|uniref:Type II secretion system (T2SS) protein F n=1 Tax=Blastococcus xanthinilyticus TaxID=1564164 RepID=A0A5S5CRZ3_9ACTN|nr:type II secretion system F family protein [Blastococcus xanthinilyticus]TYP84767.1 type II secretion system (T2SS) protein F [Blastococcus xanthinilyticus]
MRDGAWLPVLLLAAACAVAVPSTAVPALRARGLRRPGGAARRAPEVPRPARNRWLLAGAAGLSAGLLLGGVLGVGAALAVAGGADRLLRAAVPDEDAAARAALARDLPGACELLAVCLAAGLPVAGALAAVGDAVPAPLGSRLRGVAALLRLGADPRRAWAEVPAELAPLGRALVRAGESGVAAAPALRTLAAESRSADRADAEAAVQRGAVWVLAPLGVCFLPAFVCLGVAPLVLGIAGDVFG